MEADQPCLAVRRRLSVRGHVVRIPDRHPSGQGPYSLRRIMLGFCLVTAVVWYAVLPDTVVEAQLSPTCSSIDVLILLDESGSIDRNDPHDRRIEAAKQYLVDLGKHEDIKISVALAGFASTFELYSNGFLSLDSNADLLDRLVHDFAERHAQYQWDEDPYRWHTDYVEAFRGLLDMPWDADCRRTVWFTDGRHDLDPGGPRLALTPRPYDSLQRDLSTSSNLNAVEDLLAPAICGEEDYRPDIPSDYFGLADQLAASQVDTFEIKLFYLTTNRPYGKTLDVFERLNRRECGSIRFEHRPVDDINELTDEWLFDASCQSLPGPALNVSSKDDVIWDGALPVGVIPETVQEVEILASGGSAFLATGHTAFVVDDSNPSFTRLTLSFDRAAMFDAPRVSGTGVEQACGTVTFLPLDLTAESLTFPALAGRPLQFSLRVNSHQGGLRPLTPAERQDLAVFRNGQVLDVEWVGDGNIRDPAALAPGRHEYLFRVRYADPVGEVSTSTAVELDELVVTAEIVTSRSLAGQPLRFTLQASSTGAPRRPLTAAEREDLVVFRDGEELDYVWAEGAVEDPAAPPPGDHDYRFELRHGEPPGWASETLEVRTEGLSWKAESVTSPVFAEQPLDFVLELDAGPIDAAQRKDLVVFRDGEELDYVWIEDGVLRDPAAPLSGVHEYRFELRYGHPNGWVSETLEVESVVLPPGPVMALDRTRLEPLAGREFPIPVRIDNSRGCVALDPSVTVEGGDGEPVSGTVAFANGETEWCSDSGVANPENLFVSLESQTNTESGVTVGYVSVSPQDERQAVALSAPGPIDRLRNQNLERLIVSLFLMGLLALLWGAMYGVSRFAGRLPRLRARYAEFLITEDGSLRFDIGESDHRKARRKSAGRIDAGRLRVVRKTPFWQIWRAPYTELSLGGVSSQGLVDGEEIAIARSHKISKQQLRRPIVLVEAAEGRRRGVVMAEMEGSDPTGRQLTRHAESTLDRIKHR